MYRNHVHGQVKVLRQIKRALSAGIPQTIAELIRLDQLKNRDIFEKSDKPIKVIDINFRQFEHPFKRSRF
jgi:hypothetical protein